MQVSSIINETQLRSTKLRYSSLLLLLLLFNGGRIMKTHFTILFIWRIIFKKKKNVLIENGLSR
ncbi:Uncharacterized protein APZ42_028503 [Daphnia magna]|uniref:Uncharacterized protein n=1 Tax=Daphnia magna TaxID=35525 RepID=A0A162D6V1_9CRUS|nr:Uncharacterized protein APZ42_028503 [Daphnia magna]